MARCGYACSMARTMPPSASIFSMISRARVSISRVIASTAYAPPSGSTQSPAPDSCASTCCARRLDVRHTVGERERHLLHGVGAGLADVVAGDGDRVPARHLRLAPGEGVD